MKNYILLGIGIGMIISGSIFTFFDNKEYSKLETKIREEVIKEMSKEKIFDDIEEEFSSIVEEKKVSLEEKTEEKKVEEEKKIDVKEKEEEKQEAEVVLAKFYPLPGGENIYNIQFRSSSDKEDIIKVQEMLNPVIDTKIEFIQGYYRLFAKDLYSEEYAEMLVHEVKKSFSLNPIIRSPKQFDYLVLGPKKYNEKYNIEEVKSEEKKAETASLDKEIVSKEEKQENKVELSSEEDNIQVNLDSESDKKETSVTSTEVKKDEATEAVSNSAIVVEEKVKEDKKNEDKEKVEADKVEQVEEVIVENKNTKLIFVEDGSQNQMEFIKSNIQDLMELDVKEVNGLYKVESKDYFSEVVADDLVSKLNLLFNLDIKKDKK